jgi:putative tryptophan/tyrosine transport system substrate-binding protein
MRRREFLGVVGGSTLALTRGASAQSTGARRISVLVPFGENDTEGQSRLRSFTQGIEAAGWIVGRNLEIHTRYGGSNAELMSKHALEVVASRPDIVFVQSSPLVARLKAATQDIPTVFVNVTDPVEAGFVTSLARPGGNITGFSNFEYAIAGKWLELLKQMAPSMRRALVLINERNPSNPRFLRFIEVSAPAMGISVTQANIHDLETIEKAIASFATEPNGGLIVPPDNTLTTNRERIVSLATQHRLPAIYVFRAFVGLGGLMAYGIDVADIFRKAAQYVDRILRGASPGDLPIQAPTKFEFVVNMKVARTLGLSPPPSLIALADEVIE